MALPPPAASSTCLVTGASSGIGADIARELAARGQGVTLVARREERLRELARELEGEHGVRVEIAPADVADADARAQLVAEVERRGLAVEVLVNNAGFGSGGLFHELDPDGEVAMVRTNVEAVVALCGAYVPGMVDRGRGAVLNVSSVAAFEPLPRQATYAASKAFVLAFTEALHTELQDSGVTATALCPGFVHTEFDATAGIGGLFDGLPSFLVMPSADAARAGVEAMEEGRRSVVPRLTNLVLALGARYVPRTVVLPVLRRLYLRGM